MSTQCWLNSFCINNILKSFSTFLNSLLVYTWLTPELCTSCICSIPLKIIINTLSCSFRAHISRISVICKNEIFNASSGNTKNSDPTIRCLTKLHLRISCHCLFLIICFVSVIKSRNMRLTWILVYEIVTKNVNY